MIPTTTMYLRIYKYSSIPRKSHQNCVYKTSREKIQAFKLPFFALKSKLKVLVALLKSIYLRRGNYIHRKINKSYLSLNINSFIIRTPNSVLNSCTPSVLLTYLNVNITILPNHLTTMVVFSIIMTLVSTSCRYIIFIMYISLV